jgi:hypothetical protein
MMVMVMAMMHGGGKRRTGKHYQEEGSKDFLHGSNPSTNGSALL